MNLAKLFRRSGVLLKNSYSQTASCSSGVKKYEKLNKNYDIERLNEMSHDKLVYRTMKLQRLLDTYQLLCDPIYFCGTDKMRIDHPCPEDIVTDQVSMRKVAFKILYLGWDYAGYAWEDRSWHQAHRGNGYSNIVERLILEALLRQQLIPVIGNSKHLGWDRAGRTDRLVSGSSQVVTVRLRSAIEKGYGLWTRSRDGDVIYDDDSDVNEQQFTTTYLEDGISNSDTSLDEGELPYVKLLNDALPFDIRVVAWAPVSRKFSARYDCKSRTYRYVFPKGRLNIDLMNEAAQKFVGSHDFRNFCKKSRENLFKHFERTIFSFKVEDLKDGYQHSECDMCAATISGSAFLQQQIRLMMSMLSLIGSGEVPKEKIDELLDVELTPRKPGYNTFNAINLTLIDAKYDEADVSWRWDQQALVTTGKMLAQQYGHLAVKSNTVKHMYDQICSDVEYPELLEHLAQEFTDSLSAARCEREHGLHSDLSKTIEEKQEAVNKREIRSLMSKGSYRKAALLQAEYIEKNNDSVKPIGTA